MAVLGAALPARADDADDRAARAFAEGQQAFDAKDYARAAEQFEAAYADKPHHAPLWNAARSWHRAGESVRAANLYARYLREAPPDARDRDNATAALAELSPHIGRLELHTVGVAHVTVDGVVPNGETVYVAPGEHVVEADGALGKTVSVQAGETASVTLTPLPPPPPPEILPKPERPKKPLSPIVVYAGGALSLVAGGLFIGSGLDTVSKYDAYKSDRTQGKLDDAYASEARTNVLLGTAIGLAVITGVVAIFWTDWSGPRAVGDR
jgi:hypothetical protein